MTAFILTEKPASKVDTPNEEEHKSRVKGQRRTVLVVAVITSLITALFLFGVFLVGCGLYRSFDNSRSTKTNSEEWIFWSRSAGNVTLHESAVINEEEQTALMVSAEAYKINDDNSLALHDFKKGFVALRDFNAETCFVSRIQFPEFSYVKKMLEERQGKKLPRQPLQRVGFQKNVMTSSDLGPKLAEFCKGVPAHWFDEISDNDYIRRTRRGISNQQIPTGALCFINEFQFEELSAELMEHLKEPLY